eukprot:SAG11_NODE_11635_length_745_cov_1.300926_2_plen_132_part_01
MRAAAVGGINKLKSVLLPHYPRILTFMLISDSRSVSPPIESQTSSIARYAAIWPARKLSAVSIDAVAGRRGEAAAAAYADAHGLRGARIYGSYATLLDDEALEAVYISVPTRQHHTWALAALRAGKHVLVEK